MGPSRVVRWDGGYPPFVSIDVNGPELTSTDRSHAAVQLHQTGHSCIVQHFQLATCGPARYVRINVHNFCESCNRVRLTCTVELYMCLGQDDMADLRKPMRDHADNVMLQQAIREAILRKPKGHNFDYSRQKVDGQVTRHMSHTGG